MPDLETGRRRCADFQRALARVRRSAGQRADRADPARARRLVERALADGLPERRRSRQQPDRGAAPALRDGRGPRRAAPSTRTGTSRPTGSSPAASTRCSTSSRRGGATCAPPAWTSTSGGTGAATSTRRPRTSTRCCTTCSSAGTRASSRSPARRRRALPRATHRARPRAAPACSRPTTATAWSTTTSCDYLRELARHADVFYLADGVLDRGELDKLDGIAAGRLEHAARGVRLRLLVAAGPRPRRLGTARAATTRSCSPTTAASWSGRSTTCSPRWTAAPATGGACRRRRWSSTRTTSARTRRCRSTRPSATWSDRAAGPTCDYLHLSSYFQVLRRPVLDDPGFRFRLDTVCGQRTKQLVVDKYEIGISRYLMDSGLRLRHLGRGPATRSTRCTRGASFDLDRARASRWSSATSSPRTRATCPGFAAWPEWLRAAAPDAPIDLIRASIDRVSPDDRIQRGLSVGLDERTGRRVRPQRPLAGRTRFRWMAEEEPKLAHWWAFPVTADDPPPRPGRPGPLRDRPRRPDDPQGRADPLASLRPRRRERGRRCRSRPGRARSSWRGAARSSSTGRRALRSTCPWPRAAHQFVHVGSGLPDRPDADWPGWTAGSKAFRDAAARLPAPQRDGRGQPGGRAGEGGRHASQPAPAVDHRPATARPGHPRPGPPARRPPPAGAGAARPARRPPAARAVAATGTTSAPVRRGRARLAGGVVPPPRRGPRRARGSGRPRREPHPAAHADRGLGALRPEGAGPLRRAPGGRCRAHRRRRRGRRLPAHRAAAARTDLPERRDPETSRSATTRRDAAMPGPCCTSFDELDGRPRRRLRAAGRRAVASPTGARSTSRSRTPTTCRAGVWSSGSDASTSTSDGAQRFGANHA